MKIDLEEFEAFDGVKWCVGDTQFPFLNVVFVEDNTISTPQIIVALNRKDFKDEKSRYNVLELVSMTMPDTNEDEPTDHADPTE